MTRRLRGGSRRPPFCSKPIRRWSRHDVQPLHRVDVRKQTAPAFGLRLCQPLGYSVKHGDFMIKNTSMPQSDVIPVLSYRDVPEAVAWLVATFGFTERLLMGSHRAQLSYGSGDIVVSQDSSAPSGHAVMVRVSDVDAHHQQAKRLGAEILRAPETFSYGERQYSVSDIGGHVWTFSQSIGGVDPSSWGGQLSSAVV
jgi:uncharacterized glyoxalase superfamily protein PhnB